MKTRTLFLLMLLVLPSLAIADEDASGFWSFQLENDLLGSRDDRFYTHGDMISYASIDEPPGWLASLAENTPFYQTGEESLYGFSLGMKIFTPQDIEQKKLIENDRPYAGWIFLNSGIAHLIENKGGREVINGLILTLGIVGPSSMAENVQKEVHRVVKADKPRGWDNQLEDELGINITYVRKRRQIFNFDEAYQFELSHHGGLTLGNVYTYASAGIMARWGTHLIDDIGPPTISPGFPGAPAFDFHRQSNWYVFAGFEARAVARNIFLDGNTIRDSHSVDKKPLVGDLQLGIAYHFNDMRISFSQMYRTLEFDGQDERTQYGAINFTFYTE